jgi:hypothetical protein
MKQLRLLLLNVLLGTTLVACNGGVDRANTNVNTYGHLIKTSDPLNSGYSLAFLQGGVQPLGVCFSITNENGSPPSPLNNALCGLNNQYIQSAGASQLFNMNSSNHDLSNFITNNSAGVTTVTPYQLIYNTPGQPYLFAGGSPSNEQVSGLILVPNNGATIKGIVLYYHGTVLDKTGVPSTKDDPEGLRTAYILAAVYASQGYIVVAPDYVGQGEDAQVMHPYAVYPQVNALSGIFMLNAAQKFLTQNYPAMVPPQDQPLSLYITSYSEGGAYALWASRFLQNDYAAILTNNNLELKRTVGISGSYNLSGVQLPFVYQNSNNYKPAANPRENRVNYNVSPGMTTAPLSGALCIGDEFCSSQVGAANFNMAVSKANLASYAFTSFINYHYNSAAFDVFFKSNTDFLSMNTCLNFVTYLSNGPINIINCPYNGMQLQQLFTNTNLQLPDKGDYRTVSEAIGTQIFSSAMGSAGDNGLSTYSFFTGGEKFSSVIKSILTGAELYNSVGMFVNPVSSDIKPVIAKADTWQFTTNKPISLVYMKYDSVVTNVNSEYACNMSGQSGITPQSLVNCNLVVDNTNLYSQFSKDVPLPLFLEHGDAEFTLNLVALAQIQQN